MSQGSQTAAVSGGGFPRRFAIRLAITMAAGTAIVVTALGSSGATVGGRLGDARLHAPDVAIWSGMSMAIKVHVVAALAALVLGAALMLSRKGRRFHRLAGWTWVGLVSVAAGATLFITSLNQGSWSILHLFTGWTLLVLPLAVVAAKRHDVARHRRTMMGLFYGGFAINFFVAFIPGRSLWQMFFG